MDSEKEVKFVPMRHGYTLKRGECVVIVGQNPGRQRSGEKDGISWSGNKSADLLLKAIEPLNGLVLTNICSYQKMTDQRVEHGIIELLDLIEDLDPRKVICLGKFSFDHVMKMGLDIEVIQLYHPSYVVRFKKDQDQWINQLRGELE